MIESNIDNDPDRLHILDEFRRVAKELGKAPSRSEFKAKSGLSEWRILRHFPNYREAVRAAGLQPDSTNLKLSDEALLEDWGQVVRKLRQIPTNHQYRREGKFGNSVYIRHFGPWSAIPGAFRQFATGKSEWVDVLALLPTDQPSQLTAQPRSNPTTASLINNDATCIKHSKLDGRLTYGNPIDFRGLRHEPVNENGVVFLFGMVARELGYLVEVVQSGFPDCEAKRQIGPNKWQRVRIEFEFESRNFRDHGHAIDGCDIIVCWRHNWSDCPPNLEVLELSSVIQTLAKSED